jgi:very-short-patch-repair endonuclease
MDVRHEEQRGSSRLHGKRVAGPSQMATIAIRELAERQHGVVARRQLTAMGLGTGLIEARVAGGRLIPVFRGVYAVGAFRLERRGRWLAAVLACGEGSALSHGSAAHLWGLRRSRSEIEVVRESGHRPRPGICLHQVRDLPPGDVTVENGIPVTSLERTLLDIAGRLDQRQLERALVAADRSGRLRWPEVTRQLAEGSGRTGVGRLRRVAARVDPRASETLSDFEVDFLALCREAALPQPQVNVLVAGYLVDFLWPAQRVVVETDGYTYHRDRPAFESDHQRTAALALAGYVVHRFTWRMLTQNPESCVELVRRALSS